MVPQPVCTLACLSVLCQNWAIIQEITIPGKSGSEGGTRRRPHGWRGVLKTGKRMYSQILTQTCDWVAHPTSAQARGQEQDIDDWVLTVTSEETRQGQGAEASQRDTLADMEGQGVVWWVGHKALPHTRETNCLSSFADDAVCRTDGASRGQE